MVKQLLLSVTVLLLIVTAASQQDANTSVPGFVSKPLGVVQRIAQVLNTRKGHGGRKGKGQPCMDYVRSLPYPRHWLAQLKPDSRPLPDINQPNIGYGDWDDSMKVSWQHGYPPPAPPPAPPLPPGAQPAQTKPRRQNRPGIEQVTAAAAGPGGILKQKQAQQRRQLLEGGGGGGGGEESDLDPNQQAGPEYGPPEHLCSWDLFGTARFKMYKGVLYAWRDDYERYVNWAQRYYRDMVVEMLLVARYLYQDYPDTWDLWFCQNDRPCQCDQSRLNIPFLQMSVLNLTKLDGTPFDVNPMHFVRLNDGVEPLKDTISYTRGFVVPQWYAYRDVAMASKHLRTYADCINSRVEGRWYPSPPSNRTSPNHPGPVPPFPAVDLLKEHMSWGPMRFKMEQVARAHNTTVKLPDARRAAIWANQTATLSEKQKRQREEEQVIIERAQRLARPLLDPWAAHRIPRALWRGTNGGHLMGWSPKMAEATSGNHVNKLASLFMNMRTYLSVVSRPYPWMDVGMLGFFPGPRYHNVTGTEAATMLKKGRFPMEEWGRYMATISIDGNGPPFRLPQQFLTMSPIIKIESPLMEPFARRIIPHVHYIPVRHDLSDIVEVTRKVLEEGQRDSSRLRAMAVAARDMAVESFNALAQLDSFIWGFLKAQKACTWKVRAPWEHDQQGRRILVDPETEYVHFPPPAPPGQHPTGDPGAAYPPGNTTGSVNGSVIGTSDGVTSRPKRWIWKAAQKMPKPHERPPPGWRVVKIRSDFKWASHGLLPVRLAALKYSAANVDPGYMAEAEEWHRKWEARQAAAS